MRIPSEGCLTAAAVAAEERPRQQQQSLRSQQQQPIDLSAEATIPSADTSTPTTMSITGIRGNQPLHDMAILPAARMATSGASYSQPTGRG